MMHRLRRDDARYARSDAMRFNTRATLRDQKKRIDEKKTFRRMSFFLEEPNGLDAHIKKLCVSKATVTSSFFTIPYYLKNPRSFLGKSE